jgi:hypothetical protein
VVVLSTNPLLLMVTIAPESGVEPSEMHPGRAVTLGFTPEIDRARMEIKTA